MINIHETKYFFSLASLLATVKRYGLSHAELNGVVDLEQKASLYAHSKTSAEIAVYDPKEGVWVSIGTAKVPEASA